MDDFDISEIDGFDWDKGNSTKNETKHNVTRKESEEIFFNNPLFIAEDLSYSTKEKRFYALGMTNNGTGLFISFTLRDKKIRVISARKQNKKERQIYSSIE